MSDFQVRSDAVDVEQIMEQIRRRIRDKRGVDYTEAQVRELASVRLEKFLDPKNLRSDLLEQFRKSRPADDAELPPPTYEFEDTTLYDTHRGLLRTIRRWLNPLLKLFFNPNMIVNVLHQQANLNRHFVETTTQARVDRAAWNALYYEVLHNLVLETTRAEHRAEEPQDARRGVVEPARLLRTTGPRPRRRGAVPARGGRAAGAAGRAGRDRWRRRGGGWRAGTRRAGGRGGRRARRRGPAAPAAPARTPWPRHRSGARRSDRLTGPTATADARPAPSTATR